MDKFLKRKCDSMQIINSEASTSSNSVDDTEIFSTGSGEKVICNKIRKPNRQYSEEYICFGFTWTGEQEFQIPECIVCGEKLSNSAMVPAKLKRHFTTKHPNLSSKNRDYFKRLLDMNANQKKYFEKTVKISDKAQMGSYKVAELIELKLKPHTIAESLILPACCEIVKIMFGDDAKKEIMKIPLSDDTIKKGLKICQIILRKMLPIHFPNTSFLYKLTNLQILAAKLTY